MKIVFIIVKETKTKRKMRSVDGNMLKAKELSSKLEELILETHFYGGDLQRLYDKVDFCVEHWAITPNEAKTLKNGKMMKELAEEIYG